MRLTRKKIIVLTASLFALITISFLTFRFVEKYDYVSNSPYDVLISDITEESVIISWKTENEIPTHILIGESEKLWGDGEPTTSHRVKLSGLKASSRYTFKISDGKRIWDRPLVGNSFSLSDFVVSDFAFETTEPLEGISIPIAEELRALPNELVYVTLHNRISGEYYGIKSAYANKYGGVVVDRRSFNTEYLTDDMIIKNIEYFSYINVRSANRKVYASEINCNQKVPRQEFDGLSREKFADLATRWVAGRGKNYAYECYYDVIYRARREGVDPAFALSIWLNESGASNYTQNSSLYGFIEDFGIHRQPSAPVQNFDKQIEYFLKLKHTAQCPGLTAWEAWGNNYRWGNCNESNQVRRQIGIDYYRQIEKVYGWVSNGRPLPSKVAGLEKVDIEVANTSGWGTIDGPLCCALKITGQEKFQGDFENNVGDKSCEEVWKPGRTLYGGTLEYSVEIKDKVAEACEVKYSGVCCKLTNDVKWYPSQLCTQVIQNISTSEECKSFANERACFFRDGMYSWLPKYIADDYLSEVKDKSTCESRNNIQTYKIELSRGVNFIGLDFNPMYHASPMYASTLIEMNPKIMLIGNFEGYDWKDLIKQSDSMPFAGEDFELKQNKGYLVVVSENSVLEIDGWKDLKAKYIKLDEGWNLVGGHLYSQSYNASGLIRELKSNEIEVQTVGMWTPEIGMFTYRIENNQGEVFGEDFRLTRNHGIFLRK
jgi:hypothetical protein